VKTRTGAEECHIAIAHSHLTLAFERFYLVTRAGTRATIKNSELLQSFKEMDVLPEQELTMLVKIIRAYVRDFKARQTYAV
jgi:hypothetical protein